MNDKQLRQHVIDELDFEPGIDSADIGVVAENGVVTLSGHVPTYAQRLAAERAAWRVKGVRAVAQDIKVHPSGDPESDEEIAKRALGLLHWDSSVPKDTLRVTVSDGWLTLHGEVQWQFQRINAEKDIRNLRGLTGISNHLTLKPVAQLGEVQRHIEDALRRHAEVEARKITVQVGPGGEVTLEGTADTWRERRAIEHAAWSVPGVRAVDDRITIG